MAANRPRGIPAAQPATRHPDYPVAQATLTGQWPNRHPRRPVGLPAHRQPGYPIGRPASRLSASAPRFIGSPTGRRTSCQSSCPIGRPTSRLPGYSLDRQASFQPGGPVGRLAPRLSAQPFHLQATLSYVRLIDDHQRHLDPSNAITSRARSFWFVH